MPFPDLFYFSITMIIILVYDEIIPVGIFHFFYNRSINGINLHESIIYFIIKISGKKVRNIEFSDEESVINRGFNQDIIMV
jgi:hypothetical protein